MTDEIRVTVSPRLVIEGVDDAIDHYRSALGAELIERFATPDGRVVHAALRIGDSVVSLTEHAPGWGIHSAASLATSPVLLHITVPDPDVVAAALVAGGGALKIRVEDRPYGKREGRVRDRFGHLWIVSCPVEDLSDEEIQHRLDAM